jgi:N-acetyl-anhydromuramyl-L-alanine amidase AmpD
MRCPFASWQPSPNYTRGRSGVAVDRVVIHQTDGQPHLERAAAHLCNAESERRVSAHFLVGQGGELVQLVGLDDTAWHCSGWNKRSIGIEHIARTPGELGKDDPGLPLTKAQLIQSVRLVAWLLRELGLPLESVMPHCSSPVTTHKDCGQAQADGGIWPWPEYREAIEDQLRNTPQSVEGEACATT